VIADAGIDQDRVARRAHDESMDALNEAAAAGIEEMRLQPIAFRRDQIGGGIRQQKRRRKAQAFHLNHAVDCHVTQRNRAH